jgi:radical SAM additional 4Fe4S-binding domain
MTIETIKQLLTEGKTMGVQKVGLTGGEPFLSRRKLRILGNFSVNELGIPIHIHSNGTLISKSDAKWVKKVGAEITIPIYSDNPSIHEKITNVKGSFSLALVGLRNLIAADTNVCVYVVPMKPNFLSLQSLLTMLSKEGVKRVRFLSLSPTGRAKAEFGKLELSPNDVKALNSELATLDIKGNIELTMGFCTSQTLKGLNIMEGHEECFAAENRVHLDTFGNVFPCTASSGRFDFTAGNVQMKENNLFSIWSSSPMLQFIRNFHNDPPEKCSPCTKLNTCMSGCRVKMAFKYGDVTIPNPICGGPYKELSKLQHGGS